MNIEDKIKELEKALARKQAFLSINLSFPKSSKLPADVKEEIIIKLKEVCARLAEGVESELTPQQSDSAPLSSEEITILKTLAAKVLERSSAPAPTIINASAPVESKPQPMAEPKLFATILTTENVERSLRNKVTSEDTLEVLKLDDQYAVLMSKSGNRVRIPVQDIEVNQQ